MQGTIHVVRPGLLTTVQDLGRWGHQATGVPVAGPMDTFSHRLANLLVGNPPDAATLEITLIGPELEFDTPAMIAVCGAEFDVAADGQAMIIGASYQLERGSRVQFGRRHTGARAYLAVRGGVLTPAVLGSRATHLVSGMGGWHGRALVAGDRLPMRASVERIAARRAMGLTLPASNRARLRLLPGAQADWFEPSALQTLTHVSFRVSPRSNRMGYRLAGPPLARKRTEEPIFRAAGVRGSASSHRRGADSVDGRSTNRRRVSENRIRHCRGSASRGATRTRRFHRVRVLFSS